MLGNRSPGRERVQRSHVPFVLEVGEGIVRFSIFLGMDVFVVGPAGSEAGLVAEDAFTVFLEAERALEGAGGFFTTDGGGTNHDEF